MNPDHLAMTWGNVHANIPANWMSSFDTRPMDLETLQLDNLNYDNHDYLVSFEHFGQ